ncbi:hypothetical protein H6F88_31640 [Oculatella sp. FACHB-28]|uniref:hypothetical protein n=1 Tax=Oculatella sp. FACHB-28 TaxID=2692845 RepID=UPI00168614C9|nr:hypothetical protein [Oculatella sp. FACHB-28]MBD2060496.1 hypothetical protein [Oculatella sp. FACHB-28]
MIIQNPYNAFVNAIEEPKVIPTSYVDLEDLEEVLDVFFQGTLDDVELECDKFHLPVSQWFPNSLMGQVDSEMLINCSNELPLREQAAITYSFTFDPEVKVQLLHFWAYSNEDSSFEEWVEEVYDVALNNLAIAVKSKL